ncbi:MAG: peptidoglycan DD-metalloendopeptidase family protein [Anaerolineaceae bacterium]|nr:peptidoglycan DD-metalloendopeptidase family protein [Anaerolineaceae bacterium]
MDRRAALLVAFFILILTPHIISAQTDCGVVDVVQYPVDEETWVLAQGYSVASPRHQGRFHTGADLYGGRNTSFASPVRAIANGRITYSYALGWGRDGGAIIIEHTFPDGSIYYSMYGHVMPFSGDQLPPRLSCVQAGEIIAAVADVRPAPHLHFEIRVNTPDAPGAGYTREAPEDLGYRDPLQFVANQQTWLQPYHLWHALADHDLQTPPLLLNDNSFLYVDDGLTLRRATSDGRVLWRKRMEKVAISVTSFQGSSLLTFADGTMQFVDADGNFGDAWRVPDLQPTGAPIIAQSWLLFPTAEGELVAVDENRRNVLWRVQDVPGISRWRIFGSDLNWVLGLLTTSNEVLTITGSGVVLERAPLRESASFGIGPDNTLLAYTYGGLWQIDLDSEWTLELPDAPRGGNNAALLTTSAGHRILFDGRVMQSYDSDDAMLWQTALNGVTGRVEMAQYDGINVLLSEHGDIAVINGAGRLCGQTQVFGRTGSLIWYDLGDDNTLRLAIADQILGLDWAKFTQAC